MKNIRVKGQRWFDKVNGNTYCASKIYIDGEHILTTDWTYGYGDFFIQLAEEELSKLELINNPRYDNGGKDPLWRYCSENDIKFDYEVTDGLKRELVAFSKDKPEQRTMK